MPEELGGSVLELCDEGVAGAVRGRLLSTTSVLFTAEALVALLPRRSALLPEEACCTSSERGGV